MTYYSELMSYAQGFNTNMEGPLKTFEDSWATSFMTITGQGAAWKDGLTRAGDGTFTIVMGKTDEMNAHNKTWKEALVGEDGNGGYLGAVKTAWGNYQTNIQGISDAVFPKLDENATKTDAVKTAVDNAKTASDDFKKALIGEDGTGGLVKALGDEYTAVGNVTQDF